MEHYFKVGKRAPIEHITLTSKTTAALRNMIIIGELPPAARITEISLAEAFGVSRACIREAIITLEQEGLLKRVKNHSTQVVQFNAADIDELYELRLAIEASALRNSIDRKSLNLEQMDQHVHNLTESMNLDSGDTVISWLESDMAFHREIMTAAANQRALIFWESLNKQVVAMLYRAYSVHPELINRSTDTHSKIVLAIRQGNCTEAVRLLQDHITASVDWVKKAVMAREYSADQSG